jgi:hypothetical protein
MDCASPLGRAKYAAVIAPDPASAIFHATVPSFADCAVMMPFQSAPDLRT